MADFTFDITRLSDGTYIAQERNKNFSVEGASFEQMQKAATTEAMAYSRKLGATPRSIQIVFEELLTVA